MQSAPSHDRMSAWKTLLPTLWAGYWQCFFFLSYPTLYIRYDLLAERELCGLEVVAWTATTSSGESVGFSACRVRANRLPKARGWMSFRLMKAKVIPSCSVSGQYWRPLRSPISGVDNFHFSVKPFLIKSPSLCANPEDLSFRTFVIASFLLKCLHSSAAFPSLWENSPTNSTSSLIKFRAVPCLTQAEFLPLGCPSLDFVLAGWTMETHWLESHQRLGA